MRKQLIEPYEILDGKNNSTLLNLILHETPKVGYHY
jgi:hypothetical protein